MLHAAVSLLGPCMRPWILLFATFGQPPRQRSSAVRAQSGPRYVLQLHLAGICTGTSRLGLTPFGPPLGARPKCCLSWHAFVLADRTARAVVRRRHLLVYLTFAMTRMIADSVVNGCA